MCPTPKSLRETVQELEKQLQQKDERIAELELLKKKLDHRIKELEEEVHGAAPITEIEETLRRLVTRISMILQAEKCVFMLYDHDSGELRASKPAIGFSDDDIRRFRIPATQGISGEAFRCQVPIITEDAPNDPRINKDNVRLLDLRNGICVPLVISIRDKDTNEVTERKGIGVLHVFNKRFGGEFDEEDINLLNRMAGNAAAVIHSAQTYREVIKEKQELEHVIESVYSGIIMVHSNGRVLQMNQAARKMLGIDLDARITGPLDQVITNEDVRNILLRSLNEGPELEEEITLPDLESEDEDAERIYQVQTALVKNDEQQAIGTVTIFNDITDIRSVERMKTAFVSTVSHELRTPLTSIKGFITTLLQDEEGFYDKDATREFYLIIEQECDRLTRMINDLLNVSRIEAGRALELNPIKVDITQLIEKVVLAQKSYATQHEFVVEFADNIPVITADADKIDQILTNLVGNAVKYSPDGGKITVSASKTDGGIRISVSDEGVGIPQEHLPKVFERFHRVDNRDTRKVGGTGIGLYIVKHLVEAHGGCVWVESKLGEGSCFTFELPETLEKKIES